ncbi:hypothetical protein EJ05DRAFT_538635 [Pseudovirgaria hyperparasitica]|uniref:Exosome complex protein n=1 Tax=Pseudovirgaria hyperparasitica TaxID=470096 RepID=A0A6A6W3J7_9PEZI|nr:uncharacterized protein EJ05DRAFT_538635 [Pseudovirgaria hyperparasitica]KAF2757432.1 hypothetical protein EJ05DRAFT_538635 [Pseudovirgaria hyperparasitica]
MDSTDLNPLIENLSANIDELEDALEPLLKTSLRDTSSKLPLLDKAKLHVLTTYAIESVIFSYLNLSSVDAKAHPIFEELSRVKQYFAKIKLAEEGPVKRPGHRTLDTSAANRFIKHGLSGNEQYDKDRTVRQEREKASAKIKFDQLTEKVEMERLEKKRKAQELAERQGGADEDSSSSDSSSEESETEDMKLKIEEKEPKQASHKPNRKQSNKGVEATRDKHYAPRDGKPVAKKQKSNKAPRGRSEAFQALLNRPVVPKPESNATAPKQDSDGKTHKMKSSDGVKTHKKKSKKSKADT